MSSFSVLIVEDQARFRDTFIHALNADPDIRLLGAAVDLPMGRRMFDQLRPDIMLVDLDLPGGSGIELIRHAARTHPQTDCVVISVFGDDQHVLACIQAGATGFLLKDDAGHDLPARLRTLHEGGSPISPAIARSLLKTLAPHSQRGMPTGVQGRSGPRGEEPVALSEQESRVLHLASKGFTFEEIAGFLKISPHTVMTYVKRVYRKLHVRSKVEAIYEARRMGWLHD